MTNPWIKYFDRSYQQIKQQVLTNLGVLVPEITDHTEGNLFVRLLSVWSGIAEMLGYYIDNQGREAFLSTCRLYWSGVKIANSFDYRIKSSIPSSGSIRVTINEPAPSIINIPIGTIFSTDEGLQYISTTLGTINIGQTFCDVNVKQQTFIALTTIGVSDGTENQKFELPLDVVDNSFSFPIGIGAYEIKDTLAYSISTDRHFKQSVGANGTPIIVFGDNYNGQIPTASSTISGSYYITTGSGGNIASNLITTIVSSLTLPSGVSATCTNINPTTGGTGIETLESVKRRVPLHNRTNERGVTLQDNKDLAELTSGVAKASVGYNCSGTVNIYIIPEGGGLASNELITACEDYVSDRKIIGKNINVDTAGEVHILFNIELNILPTYSRSTVVNAVKSALTTFLSYENQEISGSVYLSDIYALIENTEGVNNSDIKAMKPEPFARKELDTINELVWTNDLTSKSVNTLKWLIKMITTTTFELFRENTYLGTYSTGVLVIQTEINFTITGSYTVNDRWSFVTYKNFGSIVLEEQSIAVSENVDITINAIGGI